MPAVQTSSEYIFMIGYSMTRAQNEAYWKDREARLEKEKQAGIIDSRIEPGVVNRPPLETQIFLASIAISMKRIADTLDVIEKSL